MQDNPLFAPTLKYCETILGHHLVEPESFRIMRNSHVIIRWDKVMHKGETISGLLCYVYSPTRFGFYQEKRDKYLREYNKEKGMEIVCSNIETSFETPVNPYILAVDLFENLEDATEIFVTKEKIAGKMIECSDEESEDEVLEEVFWPL